MAKNETKRITPQQLQLDKDAFAALQTTAGYTPANTAYALPLITTVHTSLGTAQQLEAQANAAAAAARDNAVALEWEFHNLMLGAKDQVIAQFGRDSNEAQGVGLKKKSEYKARTRKAAGTT